MPIIDILKAEQIENVLQLEICEGLKTYGAKVLHIRLTQIATLKPILKIVLQLNIHVDYLIFSDYRSQNNSLKAEILSQDTTYKAQIVALENKSHEAWLNARQCERKIDEMRTENTLLRRRLTSIAETQPNISDSNLHYNNNNRKHFILPITSKVNKLELF